jgi:Ca-activated chloride channel family protein
MSKSKQTQRRKRLVGLGTIVFAFVTLCVLLFAPKTFWFTPDQQAQRLMARGEHAQAAKLFRDPLRQGVALYKDAEFEAAAAAFARVNTPEGHFNRGNALVMRGQYEDAVQAFERALKLRPEWPAALNNLEIARLRAALLKKEGGDMTGGQMGADEIVFDTGKGKREGGGTVETEEAQPLSNQELQSLWLRRVQTKPADFLRAKFAFQLAAGSALEEAK